MGMFDDLKCKYPLPLVGANDVDYQTKDTPSQFMDKYEIREDGTLWHEDYDIEDRSEAGQWQKSNPGKELPHELSGLRSIDGCMSKINKLWKRELFTGEIRFYGHLGTDWIEWSSYFVDGKLRELHLVSPRHLSAVPPLAPGGQDEKMPTAGAG